MNSLVAVLEFVCYCGQFERLSLRPDYPEIRLKGIHLFKNMNSMATTLTHDEISLLLFALQGGVAAAVPDPESCEESCPVVESVEELLCGGQLDPHQQLVRHLNNHLREAMIECGMFELMAAVQPGAPQHQSIEDPMKLQHVNQRLAAWNCQIKLDDAERLLLEESLSRLPRSSWVMMPRMMWRLRKKLKAR